MLTNGWQPFQPAGAGEGCVPSSVAWPGVRLVCPPLHLSGHGARCIHRRVCPQTGASLPSTLADAGVEAGGGVQPWGAFLPACLPAPSPRVQCAGWWRRSMRATLAACAAASHLPSTLSHHRAHWRCPPPALLHAGGPHCRQLLWRHGGRAVRTAGGGAEQHPQAAAQPLPLLRRHRVLEVGGLGLGGGEACCPNCCSCQQRVGLWLPCLPLPPCPALPNYPRGNPLARGCTSPVKTKLPRAPAPCSCGNCVGTGYEEVAGAGAEGSARVRASTCACCASTGKVGPPTPPAQDVWCCAALPVPACQGAAHECPAAAPFHPSCLARCA